MVIDFYRNTAPKNRLYRTLTGHLTATGNIKAPSDILNPTIEMSYNAYHVNINYCYIADFGRYYFIENYIIDGDTVILKLHVDVLYTYRAQILNANCIASRSSSHYNVNLHDSMIQTEDGYRYNITQLPYEFDPSTGSYILAVTGG